MLPLSLGRSLPLLKPFSYLGLSLGACSLPRSLFLSNASARSLSVFSFSKPLSFSSLSNAFARSLFSITHSLSLFLSPSSSFQNLLFPPLSPLSKTKNEKQELSALGLAELVDEGPDTPWDILIPSKIVRKKNERAEFFFSFCFFCFFVFLFSLDLRSTLTLPPQRPHPTHHHPTLLLLLPPIREASSASGQTGSARDSRSGPSRNPFRRGRTSRSSRPARAGPGRPSRGPSS